jgi:hypothetical protein
MTSSGRSGRLFASLFARYADVRTALREAVELRLSDRNVRADDRPRVQRLLE